MSRLTIDFANCLDERVGDQGLALDQLRADATRMRGVIDATNAAAGTGWERWRDLPADPVRSTHVDAVKRLVARHRNTTEHLIVLGIGGSALGNLAIQAALNPLTWNQTPSDQRDGPRLYVLDNVDPHLVHDTLSLIERDDPSFERTLVNVVSKSGETAETAAQFMVLRRRLEERLGERASDHIVATTDPISGTLRTLCDERGYETLPVPEGVGGRFSVLSPVGLFSAAMCGIDIDALLDGAADMDDRCREPDPTRNPAAILAWLLTEHASAGRTNHVMLPYSSHLLLMADWYRQLWAESLGKRVDLDGTVVHAGFTPIKALGATDQHSQIQLYREGPHDKVVMFLEVETPDRDVTIPTGDDIAPLTYLEGARLSQLLAAEKRATEYALVESRRPNLTIRFPRLDAHAVGQFIQLWQITTAMAGRLLNIDPFDQPAVETGKQATFGLMGRAGYESHRETVDRTLAAHEYTV